MIREKICKFQTPFLRYSHRISRFNERAKQISLINAKFTFVAYLSAFIDLDLHSANRWEAINHIQRETLLYKNSD